jgi:hypothetical protein
MDTQSRAVALQHLLLNTTPDTVSATVNQLTSSFSTA